MSEDIKIPEGRFGRFIRLAGLGARALLSSDSGATAEQAAEVLGELRGLPAKLGQMASYVEGFVPEEQRATYQAKLRGLCDAAPRSSSEAIRRVIEEELKAPIPELFASWEDEPFASASLGQVHRARLNDGRDVAVKVQHPGIIKAVESDLSNAALMEGLFSAFGSRKWSSRGMLEELKKRLRDELDYTLEADRQWQFSTLHQRDRTIRIPWVIDERSSRHVLTTELATGSTLEQATEEPEALRRTYAETLWRFVFKAMLVSAKFNADPHPGNYLFHPDGKITFLDFGCIQPLAEEILAHYRGMHFAALRGDERAFANRAARMFGAKGGRYEELAVNFCRHGLDPLFQSRFHLDRAYATSLVQHARGFAGEVRSMKAADLVPMPTGMLFMNRLQLGLYSVLARLDVEVDYAMVERTFLTESGIVEEGARA
jgi:predicted unusual protein kinase regulating ubiquinone biosynthesis (AarF/ABC1/UbiB family)